MGRETAQGGLSVLPGYNLPNYAGPPVQGIDICIGCGGETATEHVGYYVVLLAGLELKFMSPVRSRAFRASIHGGTTGEELSPLLANMEPTPRVDHC